MRRFLSRALLTAIPVPTALLFAKDIVILTGDLFETRCCGASRCHERRAKNQHDSTHDPSLTHATRRHAYHRWNTIAVSPAQQVGNFAVTTIAIVRQHGMSADHDPIGAWMTRGQSLIVWKSLCSTRPSPDLRISARRAPHLIRSDRSYRGAMRSAPSNRMISPLR